MSGKLELVNLRDGRAALERARALGEVRELKKIGDLAAAARRFAEAQGMSEDAKRYAAEMELDAKRYLGEVLAKQPKNEGGRPPKTGSPSEPVSVEPPSRLADLGVTKRQSHEAQKLAAIPEEVFQALKASVRSDSLTIKRVLRVAREREAQQRHQEPPAGITVLPSGIEVRQGDLRSALDDLAGEVDAIVTDPPYPAEYLGEFDALGELATRLLKPGGVLAAMVGQAHLPEYIRRLSDHLPYRWCGAYLTEGPATRIYGRRVGSKWKPILIYGGERFLTQDVFTSQRDDKRHHHWGQSESGIGDLVERLTIPGELVVDPFLGGGTTAVVCRDLGRRFVGCDVDRIAVRTAEERLVA